MICPRCQSEYRPGFTRCATCNVDLVDPSIGTDEPGRDRFSPKEHARPPVIRARDMVDYCGFLGLEEARGARDELGRSGIHAEVVLKDTEEGEEFWLRVPLDQVKDVVQVLGYDATEPTDREGGDSFGCSECGATVPAEASTCPGCGASFE